MRSLTIMLIVWLTALPLHAASETTVATKIRDVVLFTNQAQVTRVGVAAVQKGFNRLVVPIKAFQVDRDAVTARVYGRGEMLGVQYREQPVMRPPQEQIRKLQKKLEALEARRTARQDEKQTLMHQERFLKSFVDFSQTQVPKDMQTRLPETEDMARTLAFLQKGFSEVYAQRLAVDKAVTNLNREIDAVRRELQSIRRPARKTERMIEIQFTSFAAQKVGVETEYLARNASWSPVYRAAVSTDLSDIELAMSSRIVQRTGEDWTQVNLSVSNVIPMRGGRLPEPRPWLLDIPRPRPSAVKQKRAMAEADRMVAQEQFAVAADEVVAAPAPTAAATRRESALSFEYGFPRKVDIESRKKDTVLPLFSKKLTGTFYHYAVPRQGALAYLVCEAKADRELLAGPLNIYFANRYVGKMHLEEKKAGGNFRLGLGADRAVKIVREKITDKLKETFFGKIERGSVVREIAYRITAENLKDKPVTLHLVDTAPVSRTDRISVKDLELKPEPTARDIDGRKGVMRWEMSMAPGAKRTIDIRFVVIHPKETPVLGL